MTIEIRELVIEARITETEGFSSSRIAQNIAKKKEEEARWVTLISQKVLERLSEERRIGE